MTPISKRQIILTLHLPLETKLSSTLLLVLIDKLCFCHLPYLLHTYLIQCYSKLLYPSLKKNHLFIKITTVPNFKILLVLSSFVTTLVSLLSQGSPSPMPYSHPLLLKSSFFPTKQKQITNPRYQFKFMLIKFGLQFRQLKDAKLL